MDENVYKTPDASLDGITIANEYSAAVWWQRLLNSIIDSVVYLVFSFVLGFVLAILGMFGLIESIPDIVFGVVILCLYYIPCEFFWGRTLGKLITGTKVVDSEGGKPTFGRILGRTFARFVPFEAFSFLGRKQPKGWHDSWSNTMVISTRKGS